MTTETTTKDWARRIREHGGLSVGNMIDAGQNGADTGWEGFTYNEDLIKFCDKHGDEAWSMLCDYAKDCGIGPLECLPKGHALDDWDGLRYCIAWWLLAYIGSALAEDDKTANELRAEFADPEEY